MIAAEALQQSVRSQGEVLEQISAEWNRFNDSQRRILWLLFERQEATVPQASEELELSKQAIRYNLKKLKEIGIVVRVSKKIRDPDALYCFRNA